MKLLEKLIDVKSIVTLVLTLTFVALAVMGVISGDKFFEIYIMIISFYFGTQYQKNSGSGV
ncbi:MAG: hypothetical protein IKY45_01235 [Clostridia bacterium]|nr:hypothetical protein [Clostridia bacterium]